MTHSTRRLVGRPLETRAGVARVVSRVDLWSCAGLTAMRHRPVAVEVSGDKGTTLYPVADPGFVVSVLSNFLSVLTIARRRR